AQGSKQPGALRTLLHGPTIELTAAEVPLGARTLLGGTHTVERCSPHELIASMSSAFGEVKSVVCAIVEAWELLAPSIGAVRQLLESCSDLAAELGEPQGEELARAEQQVQRLGA